MAKYRVYKHILAALLCLCVVKSEGKTTQPHPSPTPLTSSHDNISTTVLTTSTNSSDTTQDITPSIEGTNDPENNTSSDDDDFSFTEAPNEIIPSTTSSKEVTTEKKDSNVVDEKNGSTAIEVTTEKKDSKVVDEKNGSTAIVVDRDNKGSTATGIVFLILILIFIIILVIILYILWKKGRSYSFDLTYHANDHDTPLRSMEQGGTFEQSIKESEAVQDYIQDEKPQEGSPVANGHAVETDPKHGDTEQTSSSDVIASLNLLEEDSFLSDTSLTPPMKKVEFNLDLDLIGRESELASSAPDDTSESQQNENNNNVTNAGNDMDVFTEINLDEAQ
ncbi:uncharacterized protein LOC143496624 [Brachyhypopomus gauderio]|uniref:uncharacterized protein LOC143496624 n=1 Tax=Brachyhypopomus gauderio TaxID=698409 RepID=UPI0040421B04